MSESGLDGGSISVLRVSALLDSVRALHETRSLTAVRSMLEEHIFTLIRELVPSDEGFIAIDRTPRTLELERKSSSEKISVPLLVKGEPTGQLCLVRRQPPFRNSEKLVLSAVGRLASVALENAIHVETLQEEVERQRRAVRSDDEMAGNSGALNALRQKVHRVAAHNTTVLILGESGTGKELVARSIHLRSPRAAEPFIAINCAALTESLLESELFGHEKGAFTGASALKHGLIEAANGGTVFLDEVGEMPKALQAKLLRLLQLREFQRVGGTQTIKVDVRVVAATNRDLEAAVRRGSFREDLFHRLNVVTLRTPPLRERPEDILPLAHHFLNRFASTCARRLKGISPTACNVLQSYDWPGNVRELENAIEHAVVLGSADTILPEDLPESLLERWAGINPAETGMLQQAVNTAKRAAVKRAFDLAGQDHIEAARLLGVHPNYLYRLLKNLNFPIP